VAHPDGGWADLSEEGDTQSHIGGGLGFVEAADSWGL
jgi:hypothetical protein